jgi:hypothetical protein
MVHIATISERGITNAIADLVNRKRSMYSGESPPPPSKRHATSSSAGPIGSRGTSGSQGSGNYPQCSKCGRLHRGEYKLGMKVCFKCGKTGHFIRECPQASMGRGQGSQISVNQPRQTAPAWVFALTPDNVLAEENTIDVVIGTIPLFGSVACVLFDSGAMHSFNSLSYVKLCRLSTKPLEQNICVAM